ncbi:MAG: RNA pseudouridine synthase [Firmicutes bacterium]|nr:RNA pseudouridine synthase [Bacillota bacterium]
MKKEKLKIVYEDKDIIVVNKKAGVLTVSTEKEKEKTLFHELLTFQKQKNKNNKIFIVHRLDKDTSGLVIFAKSEKVKNILQANWDNVKREYVALVHGKVKNKQDSITSFLVETKTLLVYSSKDSKKGKYAKTDYEVLTQNNEFSLLKINIKTGRKNQIRVHLNDIGHPIVGDKKYGKWKKEPLKRLCLHATKLELIHPTLNRLITFTDETPSEFECLITKKVSK